MNKRGAAIQKGSLSPDVPWRVLDYPGQCFCQCCTGLARGSLSALCPWSLLLQQHRRVNGDRLGWCNCEWHDFSKWWQERVRQDAKYLFHLQNSDVKGLGAQKHTSSEWWTVLSWGLRGFSQHPLQTPGLSGSPCTQLCPWDPCERGWWQSTLLQSQPALPGKCRLFTTKGHSCFLWFASLPCCTDTLMWIHAHSSQ